MLDSESIMRFALYAYVAIFIVMFTFGYVFLYWAQRQAPERRARSIERLRRFSDQGLQLYVRLIIVSVVVGSVLLLVSIIVAIILDAR